MKPIPILLAFAAVLAVPPSLLERVERLENMQLATMKKLLVTMNIVEAQERELAALRACLPECFPPEEWDGDLYPVPPDKWDGEPLPPD